jgi:glucose-1-phosphatase
VVSGVSIFVTNLHMAISNIKALLFDLGGVVVEIDFNRAFTHWQPISRLSLVELKAAFAFDVPYQQHERGEITANEYFAYLARHLQLQDDLARIAEGWNSIFIAEITETRLAVEAARAQLPCYAFTNTNAAHQAAWSAKFPAVVRAFDRIFVSSEIGHRKPDRSAFEFVARSVGVPMESILFFDDTLVNVEGALAAGLEAVHVRGPADVRAALQRLGCALK